MTTTRVLGIALCAVGVAACGGGGAAAGGGASPATSPSPTTFTAQVTAGQALYGESCAHCHGSAGQGQPGKAPPVVGLKTGALPLDPPPGAKYRKTQFKTVADVAAFAVKNMPADRPGSLTEEQYWDILAFDLHANGIDLGSQKLDGALAATLTIPR
jgi:mono/diheme cytochrome c family protein